jgi:hypothetical protein
MDFSGLTDMAVGTAALFGIRSPENFDAPFGAKNISEFWRRWHMTLTTWLTDYVFNPLRMMLRNYGNIGLVLSITVNMLLIGIWHGPHWGYAVFGFVHAIFLSIDALSTRWRKKFFSRHPFWRALATPMGVVLTWHLVIFAEIFFRAELMSTAMIVLRGIPESVMRMSELPVHLANLGRWPILVGGMGFLLIEGYNLLRRAKWLPVSFGQLPWPVRWACYYAAIYLVIEWGTYGKQFIYFKF